MKVAIGSDEKCHRTSEVEAREILETWFSTSYLPNDGDDRCLRQVDELESAYRTTERSA